MARQCPYCKQTDLAQEAVKCHHCGSWIDEGKRLDEYERFRTAAEAKLAADLEQQRKTMEAAFTTLKWVGGTVVVAVAAVSLYFGVRTDSSISDIAAKLKEQAEAEMEERLAAVTATVIGTVPATLAEHMKSAAVAEKIDAAVATTLAGSVEAEVEARFAPVQDRIDSEIAAASEQVSGETEAARDKLRVLTGDIEKVRADALVTLEAAKSLTLQTEAAVTAVSSVKSFGDAEYRQYSEPQGGALEFQIIRARGKEGLEQIPELVAGQVNALTFELGSGAYWSPVVWKYVEWLRRNPQFRYVVLVESGSEAALGYWPVQALASALEPPDGAALASRHADLHDLPQEDEIAGWTQFTDWVNNGDLAALQGLPGFRSMDDAVRSDWSNFQALDHMLEAGADTLPVVDADGRLVGIADRSQLTTHMLLQIAGRP